MLSLSKLVRLNKAKIKYDCDNNSFVVKSVRDDREFKFPCSDHGLYSLMNVEEGDHAPVIMVNTVKQNMSRYSNRQIRRATEARRFQQTIGNVSDETLKEIIKNGMIMNCTVTLEDIAVANDICGPSYRKNHQGYIRRTNYPLYACTIRDISKTPQRCCIG